MIRCTYHRTYKFAFKTCSLRRHDTSGIRIETGIERDFLSCEDKAQQPHDFCWIFVRDASLWSVTLVFGDKLAGMIYLDLVWDTFCSSTGKRKTETVLQPDPDWWYGAV